MLGDVLYEAPNLDYWLGTDGGGASLFPLLVRATLATSAEVLAASLLSSAIGYIIGFISALVRMPGVLLVTQAATTLSYSTPLLVVLLLLYSLHGDHPALYSVAAGGLTWGGTAFAVRTAVDAELTKGYLLAARSLGCSPIRVALRHILPNVTSAGRAAWGGMLAPLLHVNLLVAFLGGGNNHTGLGNIVKHGYDVFPSAWWLWFFPSLICVFMIAFANSMTISAGNFR